MLNCTCNCARLKRFEMKYFILILIFCFILWVGVAFWWIVWMMFGTYGIVALSILTIGTVIYIRYSDVESNV